MNRGYNAEGCDAREGLVARDSEGALGITIYTSTLSPY
jgi:hypothetical protein